MMAFIKKWIFRLILLLVSLLAMLLASENNAEVVITILSYPTPPLPVSWWVILAFVIGFATASLSNLVSNARSRLKYREIDKEVLVIKHELDQVKASRSK